MAEIIGSVYEIIEKLGAGGGGVVYLADHMRLKKKVVLKADKRRLSTPSELLRREVDVLKDLSHPYIPQVYDFFTENDTVYTAMDFVDGESLDKPLKEGKRFSQPQVIRWAKQLLQALDYLHSPTHGDPPRGYVHSDIKPANLMCRLNGDICLIDFNISLAVGEKNVIGASEGYASPEHYGLDFSFSGNTATRTEKTVLSGNDTVLMTATGSQSFVRHKIIIPDIRSDIYSTGATLYHLLSGRRPAKDAHQVVPLSESEASRQVAAIIAKAMNPNPDLRYQTAAEMLWDFEHLHENDSRTKRLKIQRRAATVVLTALFLVGGVSTFIGLRWMERDQQTAKEALELIQASQHALKSGDTVSARENALEALDKKTQYDAMAQNALTDALGIYDLSDGFKPLRTIELPSAPIKLALSPEGTYLAAVYAYEAAIFDARSGEQLDVLPLEPSVLSDVVFLDDDVIVYAGEGAVQAYDIPQAKRLWTGEAATRIACSADGTRVAAVYKDAQEALVYDAATGAVIRTVPFEGRSQWVPVSDIYADSQGNLLALNQDGTFLAVSFADGSLTVFDLVTDEGDLIILDPSEYVHFEGGFSGDIFTFSAYGSGDAFFAAIDTKELVQIASFAAHRRVLLQVDESGIYMANNNLLVRLDAMTGDQTELAYTSGDISVFRHSEDHTVVITEDQVCSFYDSAANLISQNEQEGFSCDFAQLSQGLAVVGSRDTPVLRVLELDSRRDAELFSYDPAIVHEEARLNADRNTVMLFDANRFYLFNIDGAMLAEEAIPDARQVYDQQYRRDSEGSRLEVIYRDGRVKAYSADDGTLLWEKQGELPDSSAYEEFFTDKYRFDSPLHGAPVVYDRETDKELATLNEEDYLTYVTQVGDYIITEYISTREGRYGLLLNDNLETLARLPYLCDIIDGELIFDYPSGDLRSSRIYSLQELCAFGEL